MHGTAMQWGRTGDLRQSGPTTSTLCSCASQPAFMTCASPHLITGGRHSQPRLGQLLPGSIQGKAKFTAGEASEKVQPCTPACHADCSEVMCSREPLATCDHWQNNYCHYCHHRRQPIGTTVTRTPTATHQRGTDRARSNPESCRLRECMITCAPRVSSRLPLWGCRSWCTAWCLLVSTPLDQLLNILYQCWNSCECKTGHCSMHCMRACMRVRQCVGNARIFPPCWHTCSNVIIHVLPSTAWRHHLILPPHGYRHFMCTAITWAPPLHLYRHHLCTATACALLGGGLSSSAAIVCSSALAVLAVHGIELTKGEVADFTCKAER